jgi:hypothetical protein
VGVAVLRPESLDPVVAGLRRDPHVDSVLVYEAVDALSPEERSICWSAECGPAHPTVCAWAREQGLDYFAFANFSGGERTVTAPGTPDRFSLDIHASSTAPGKTLSYVAYARLFLEVSETATCTKDNHLSRKLERSTGDGPSRGGGPEGMRRALLAEIPTHLAKTFPAQMIVADTGRVRATDPELPLVDGDYAVYRDGRFQGVAAVRDTAAPVQRLTRLTCCFDPRPADVLVQGRRSYLIEMTASLTLTQLAWDGSARLAAGPGFRIRFGPMARGWQGGLVADLLYVDGVSAGVGTIEAGYHLRPGPAWTIAVIAGAGGGAA